MDMLARRNVLRRPTDRLCILDHRLALGDGPIATLWPGSIADRATAPPGSTVPISMRPLATATLSAGESTNACGKAFMAVPGLLDGGVD